MDFAILELKKMMPLALKIAPKEFIFDVREFCQNQQKLSKISISVFGKCVLKLCEAAMIKPRQKKRSVFCNGPQQTNSRLQTGLGSTECSVAEKL